MKKIMLLCAAMVAMMMITSCRKDNPTDISLHSFSEQQQKVLELFHGSWREGTDCFYDFQEQYDTNVVVYEDDYVNGSREKYQYQGITSYRVMKSNGVDTAQYFTYQYYVSYDASYLSMYSPQYGSRVAKYDLQIPDATHFKIRSSNSSIWRTFEKVQ